ncbi:MAG: hypothetical protein JNL42_20480 [Anaerolineae bacterium]|nr:hypothetical protein [Anaerolineae bacterium]
MADPFPKNSRLERNPQPTPTPFARQPFGGVPARPAAAPAAAPPRPAAPLPRAQQPPQGALFERRNARVRRRPHVAIDESAMHVAAGVVLILIVLLSYLAQSPPSQITAYDPRGSFAEPGEQPFIPTAQPTPAPYVPRQFDWGPAGTSSGVYAWVIQRDLIRACPNAACVALASPTILEVGLMIDIAAVDSTRAWAMINVTRSNGALASGWLPLGVLRLIGDLEDIPVVAG